MLKPGKRLCILYIKAGKFTPCHPPRAAMGGRGENRRSAWSTTPTARHSEPPERRYVGYLTPYHPLWHCYGARYMASANFIAMPQAIVAAFSWRAAAAGNGIGRRRRQALHACKHSPWQWMVSRRVPVQAFRRAACACVRPYISPPPMMAARRAGWATPVGGTARAPALVPGCFSHGRRQGMRHAACGQSGQA